MFEPKDLPPKLRRELLQPSGFSKERSQELRRKMSLPEVLLWNEIKAGKIGYSFRRQNAIGPYIADFCCHEALLVVEVDGKAHDYRVDEDKIRDEWTRERGLEVVRIAAQSVLRDPWFVGQGLKQVCDDRCRAVGARRVERGRGVGGPPPPRGLGTPSAGAEGDL